MTSNDLDARIAKAEENVALALREGRSIAERHHAQREVDALKSQKLWDMIGRTDPSTGRVLDEPVRLPAVQTANPLADASSDDLSEALSAIQTEKTGRPDGSRRVLPSVERGRKLAAQESAIRTELSAPQGVEALSARRHLPRPGRLSRVSAWPPPEAEALRPAAPVHEPEHEATDQHERRRFPRGRGREHHRPATRLSVAARGVHVLAARGGRG
jgi:hypothetical protein